MTIDMEKVRLFLSRDDLNSFEQKVKNNCLSLEQSYLQATQDLQNKEQEVRNLQGRLEAMISLAYELEQDRQENKEERSMVS